MAVLSISYLPQKTLTEMCLRISERFRLKKACIWHKFDNFPISCQESLSHWFSPVLLVQMLALLALTVRLEWNGLLCTACLLYVDVFKQQWCRKIKM